jgi:hypothetical protein
MSPQTRSWAAHLAGLLLAATGACGGAGENAPESCMEIETGIYTVFTQIDDNTCGWATGAYGFSESTKTVSQADLPYGGSAMRVLKRYAGCRMDVEVLYTNGKMAGSHTITSSTYYKFGGLLTLDDKMCTAGVTYEYFKK